MTTRPIIISMSLSLLRTLEAIYGHKVAAMPSGPRPAMLCDEPVLSKHQERHQGKKECERRLKRLKAAEAVRG